MEPQNRYAPLILHIDDDTGSLFLMRLLMERSLGDVIVVSITCPDDALPLAVHLEPDLIITDINMPGMDGFEVVEWMHTHLPDVPLLIVSIFHLSLADRLRVAASGVVGVVQLPTTPEEMVRPVRAALRAFFPLEEAS
ncbi:MAG: response regulator [Anaerolineae bacterium]|nr:response regulator [Anaerolineae bacterium]